MTGKYIEDWLKNVYDDLRVLVRYFRYTGDVIKVNLGVDKEPWKTYNKNQDVLKGSLVVTNKKT